mgnify:CR=1 FL=1
MKLDKKIHQESVKQFENLEPNTIIVWHGLYKYERFIDSENRAKFPKNEIVPDLKAPPENKYVKEVILQKKQLAYL